MLFVDFAWNLNNSKISCFQHWRASSFWAPSSIITTVPFYQRIWRKILHDMNNLLNFLINCWTKGTFSRLLTCKDINSVQKLDHYCCKLQIAWKWWNETRLAPILLTNSWDSFTNLKFWICKYLLWFLFKGQTERKKLFWNNKKLVSFSTAQIKKNRGNNWWIKLVKLSDEFIICSVVVK